MANWAFKVGPGIPGSELEIEIADLGGGRKPRIRSGDSAFLLRGEQTELSFVAAGTVSGTEFDSDSSGSSQMLVRIADVVPFETPRTLKDYRFSLTKIRRFQQPDVHFRREYSRLPDLDARVLREGEVNYSRTALGLLATSISQRRRAEFLMRWISVSGRARTYSSIARDLLESVRAEECGTIAMLADIATELRNFREESEVQREFRWVRDSTPMSAQRLADLADQTRPALSAEIRRPPLHSVERLLDAAEGQDSGAFAQMDYFISDAELVHILAVAG